MPGTGRAEGSAWIEAGLERQRRWTEGREEPGWGGAREPAQRRTTKGGRGACAAAPFVVTRAQPSASSEKTSTKIATVSTMPMTAR